MENNYLCHYGVLGMKWGVRRASGSSGAGSSSKQGTAKEKVDHTARNKKIARAVVATASVAAAAYYVHKNPEAVGKVITKVKNVKVKDLGAKAVNAGKTYVKDAVNGAKEGAKEAIKEAPKKAAKAVVGGIILNQTKKALDSAVGKEESAKIFQANDNKKIGKFWKVSEDDREDD